MFDFIVQAIKDGPNKKEEKKQNNPMLNDSVGEQTNTKCDISCTKDLTNATMSTTINSGIPTVSTEKAFIPPSSKLKK